MPYAADLTQNSSLYPVHKITVEKYGDAWFKPKHFVGNSAYKIAEHILNEKIVLERSPTYWNDKETVVNKVTFFVLNESSGIARYRSGGLDIANIPSILYKDPNFRKEYAPQIYNPVWLLLKYPDKS